MSSESLDKIADAALRKRAESPLDENAEESVLVQVDLPLHQGLVERRGDASVPARLRSLLAPEAEGDCGRSEQRIESVRELLTKLKNLERTNDREPSPQGEAPHWLPSAKSFVLTIDPRHLRAISEHEDVLAIYLNREQKLPGG